MKLSHEIHRLCQLISEEVAGRRGIGGVRGRGRVRPYGNGSRCEDDPIEGRAERPGRVRDEQAVERRRNRQARRPDARRGEVLLGLFDFGGRPRENRLARGVAVRDDDIEPSARDRFHVVGGRSEDGEHGPRIAGPLLGHEPPAKPRECEEIGDREPAARRERRKFAVAVAREGVGPDAEPLRQESPRPEADRPDGGLRRLGGPERRVVAFLRVRLERRRRVDQVRQLAGVGLVRLLGRDRLVRGDEGFEHLRELAREVAEHPDGLRPLPGEQHREFARRRSSAVVGTVGGVPRLRGRVGREFRRRRRDQLWQVRQVALRHEDEPARRLTAKGRSRLLGGTGERLPGHVRRELRQLRRERIGRVAAERQQLHRAIPIDFGLRGPVFFEDRVEVTSAEAERRQRGAAWVLGSWQPRPLFQADVER